MCVLLSEIGCYKGATRRPASRDIKQDKNTKFIKQALISTALIMLPVNDD